MKYGISGVSGYLGQSKDFDNFIDEMKIESFNKENIQ